MPGKAGAEGERYICPQCFTAHYLNDVLFAAQRPSGFCDRRQAAYRYALGPYAAFEQWCASGETAALLNWRALPQSRRQWTNGAITAVRDLDGSWVTRRVCPCCHTPLSPPCPVVIGWAEDGMNIRGAFDLLYCAAELAPASWSMRREDQLPLRYDYLVGPAGRAVLGVPPAKLEHVGGDYGRELRRRCCNSAAGVVVRLRMRMDENGNLDDIEASHTLDTLLEACGHSGVELKMAAVFLLEGLANQPDSVKRFQMECPQLARRIQYDFESSFFAAGLFDHSQLAVQAVKWLSDQTGHLNAEK